MKTIYTWNGTRYEVSYGASANSNELLRFIEDEGLSGEHVLNLLLDWHGTQIVSDDFMTNLFECEYDLEGEKSDD